MTAMKTAYDASTTLEAHMALHQLQQAGIDARIDGEFLQGGVGELPAVGNVRVVVDERDWEAAREVIADWEAADPD